MGRIRRVLAAAIAIVAILGGFGYWLSRKPAVVAYVVERLARSRLGKPMLSHEIFDRDGLHVVLCGTSSPLPDPKRAKACTMVVAGTRAFVVDTGPESWKTLALIGFPADHIVGILLTHYHSDHIGDLGEFRLQTWVGGRKAPLPVYGGPGVERVVAGINETFALDDIYRSAHHGHDVAPIEAAPLVARPFKTGMSDTHDGAEVILEDGGLRITAFEVNHMPVRPAVGYRFDYGGRSVVVSGDTIKWPNVATNAKGADVLVHEAQSQRLRQIFADAARAGGNASIAKIFDDIESYHSSPTDAAEIANVAGVKLLVFTHFTPPLISSLLDPLFFEGVDALRAPGSWVAGYDGLRIDLPVRSDAIVQSRMPMGLVQ